MMLIQALNTRPPWLLAGCYILRESSTHIYAINVDIPTIWGDLHATIPKMVFLGIDSGNRCNYWGVAISLFSDFGAHSFMHGCCMVIQGIFRGKKERWQGYPADMIRATPAPSADLHTKDTTPALWGGGSRSEERRGASVYIHSVNIATGGCLRGSIFAWERFLYHL